MVEGFTDSKLLLHILPLLNPEIKDKIKKGQLVVSSVGGVKNLIQYVNFYKNIYINYRLSIIHTLKRRTNRFLSEMFSLLCFSVATGLAYRVYRKLDNVTDGRNRAGYVGGRTTKTHVKELAVLFEIVLNNLFRIGS